MTVMKLYAHALPAGIVLQAIACLLNGGERHSLLPIVLGLSGVALMIMGFDHLANR